MELREPPGVTKRSSPDRGLISVVIVQSLVVLALGVLLFGSRSNRGAAGEDDAELIREVSSKLKAAGAIEESAALLEDYLERADLPTATKATVAYSLGQSYLDAGQAERALRWFYEAESLGVGALEGELARKIVHTLERMGRPYAAQAALDSRVQLTADDDAGEDVARAEDDPVVARVGSREIRRSEVDRSMNDLPPGVAASLTGAQRQELLRKFVADELLWRKAQKLEYEKDPEVQRQFDAVMRQLAIARFVELEVVAKIEVDETDLRTFFEAHRDRYRQGEDEEPAYDRVRPAVQRDYMQTKMQAAYQDLLENELGAADVELFPERLIGDG